MKTTIKCTVRRGRITWLCDVCKQPIKGKEQGYLTVDTGRATCQQMAIDEEDYQKRVAAEAKGHRWVATDIRELLARPDAAPWQALHEKCDPNLERNDYWFYVERANTLPKMLNWTEHLMGKVWLQQTDWDHLLGHVAAQAGMTDA